MIFICHQCETLQKANMLHKFIIFFNTQRVVIHYLFPFNNGLILLCCFAKIWRGRKTQFYWKNCQYGMVFFFIFFSIWYFQISFYRYRTSGNKRDVLYHQYLHQIRIEGQLNFLDLVFSICSQSALKFTDEEETASFSVRMKKI